MKSFSESTLQFLQICSTFQFTLDCARFTFISIRPFVNPHSYSDVYCEVSKVSLKLQLVSKVITFSAFNCFQMSFNLLELLSWDFAKCHLNLKYNVKIKFFSFLHFFSIDIVRQSGGKLLFENPSLAVILNRPFKQKYVHTVLNIFDEAFKTNFDKKTFVLLVIALGFFCFLFKKVHFNFYNIFIFALKSFKVLTSFYFWLAFPLFPSMVHPLQKRLRSEKRKKKFDLLSLECELWTSLSSIIIVVFVS